MSDKKRILVIDDEPGILGVVNAKLTAAGYEVVTAVCGEAAIREERLRPFDLVLLDIFMVPMSGFLVLDKLRGFSDVPVIIFTAHPYLAEKALRLGANDFIAKPFDPDVLIGKIERLLSGDARATPGAIGRQRAVKSFTRPAG
jgi:DNA-binding response OmpR family regulator